MTKSLIQFEENGGRGVAVMDDVGARRLEGIGTTLELATRAMESGRHADR